MVVQKYLVLFLRAVICWLRWDPTSVQRVLRSRRVCGMWLRRAEQHRRSGGLLWKSLFLLKSVTPAVSHLCSFAGEAAAVSPLCVCPSFLSRSPAMLCALACGTALLGVWLFYREKQLNSVKSAFLPVLCFKMCNFCLALNVLFS